MCYDQQCTVIVMISSVLFSFISSVLCSVMISSVLFCVMISCVLFNYISSVLCNFMISSVLFCVIISNVLLVLKSAVYSLLLWLVAYYLVLCLVFLIHVHFLTFTRHLINASNCWDFPSTSRNNPMVGKLCCIYIVTSIEALGHSLCKWLSLVLSTIFTENAKADAFSFILLLCF